MTPAVTGALLGALLGASLLLVVRRLPFLRRPSLDDRIGPYLRDLGGSEVFLGVADSSSPFYAVLRLFEPSLRGGAARLERLLGGSASIRRRLARAGIERTVEEFRIEQVLWGAAGFGVALLGSFAALSVGIGNPLGLLLLCAIIAVLGVLSRDTYLTTQVRRRERRLLAELPTVAELLALAVAAGEGPAAALDRVGAVVPRRGRAVNDG